MLIGPLPSLKSIKNETMWQFARDLVSHLVLFMIKGKAAMGEETSTCGWELTRGVEVVTDCQFFRSTFLSHSEWVSDYVDRTRNGVWFHVCRSSWQPRFLVIEQYDLPTRYGPLWREQQIGGDKNIRHNWEVG